MSVVFKLEEGVSVVFKFIVFFFNLGINLVLINGINVKVEKINISVVEMINLVCFSVNVSFFL